MRWLPLSLLLLCLGSVSALAEQRAVAVVSEEACRLLVEHRPAPDVRYDPAAEAARGVVAADLYPRARPRIEMPVKVVLPIGEDAEAFPLEGKIEFGLVTVENGQLSLHGQLLDLAARRAVRAACLDAARN